MRPPLVSCIVPAFNAERYLRAALDSITAQTHRPIEIIVADDGSTDGTVAVVNDYPEAVVLVSHPHAGPAAARNLGLDAANGEFVAFLDADDLWHPEKLARQLARFESRPELDYCLAFVCMFWEEELGDEGATLADHPRAKPVPGYATTPLLARRRTFEVVGYFDANRWSTDALEWFDRAREHGLLGEMLPDVLVYRRMHRTNMSRRLAQPFREEWLSFVRARLRKSRAEG